MEFLNLEQRSKAEEIYMASAKKMMDLAKKIEDTEEQLYALEKELSEIYFCNFSVFQSLPDSWALKQIFPVMPLQRLNERPHSKAVLADLTCDSDGKITKFIDTETGETQSYLEVHNLEKNKPYFIGVFLVGAYQEILGDLHNLFGDTNAVQISVKDNDYHIEEVVEGDSIAEVLNYVEYQIPELIEKVRNATELGIKNNRISKMEAREILEHYAKGLSCQTYLYESKEAKELDYIKPHRDNSPWPMR